MSVLHSCSVFVLYIFKYLFCYLFCYQISLSRNISSKMHQPCLLYNCQMSLFIKYHDIPKCFPYLLSNTYIYILRKYQLTLLHCCQAFPLGVIIYAVVKYISYTGVSCLSHTVASCLSCLLARRLSEKRVIPHLLSCQNVSQNLFIEKKKKRKITKMLMLKQEDIKTIMTKKKNIAKKNKKKII